MLTFVVFVSWKNLIAMTFLYAITSSFLGTGGCFCHYVENAHTHIHTKFKNKREFYWINIFVLVVRFSIFIWTVTTTKSKYQASRWILCFSLCLYFSLSLVVHILYLFFTWKTRCISIFCLLMLLNIFFCLFSLLSSLSLSLFRYDSVSLILFRV